MAHLFNTNMPYRAVLMMTSRLQYGWRLSALGKRTIINRAAITSTNQISIGLHCWIDRGAVLNGFSHERIGIRMGDDIQIREYAVIEAHKGHIYIGDGSFIGQHCLMYGMGGIDIGKKVMIAAGTVMVSAMHKYTNPNVPMMDQGETMKGITIEDNVWIGANCTILDGVTIGEHSVVAAGAVVNQDVPAGTIVAGVPAKVIKRYDVESKQWIKV